MGFISRRTVRAKKKKEGMSSLTKMRELLDEKDLDKILASSKKFRREFKLR